MPSPDGRSEEVRQVALLHLTLDNASKYTMRVYVSVYIQGYSARAYCMLAGLEWTVFSTQDDTSSVPGQCDWPLAQ